MKTVELEFTNGSILSFFVEPEHQQCILQVRSSDQAVDAIRLTTSIDEVRDIYNALPSLLCYYAEHQPKRETS